MVLCAYSFVLNNFTMDISVHAVSLLNDFVMRTGIHEMNMEDMYRSLCRNSVDGLLEKHDYDIFVKSLTKMLNSDEKNKCALILSKIFDSFDRSQSHVVDVLDLACGLSVLCAGEKSEKLAFAFDLMDEDNDGEVTKRGLWRYFRSFLSVLVTLSQVDSVAETGRTDGPELTSSEVMQICDDSAVSTSANLLAVQSKTASRKGTSVTFEGLAAWYTNGAHRRVMWLELLDLKKWLSLSKTTISTTAVDLGLGEDTVFFSCHLLGEGTERTELMLFHSDADFVRGLSLLSGMKDMDPGDLAESLQRFVTDELSAAMKDTSMDSESGMTLSEAVFSDWMSSINHSNEVQASFLYIFRWLRQIEGEVSLLSLCSSLSVLCGGSKSAKLSFGFHLFDRDEDGVLLESELVDFFGSYLTTLVALSQQATISNVPSDQFVIRRCITATTKAISAAVCSASALELKDSGKGSCTDFRSFGDWYNSGGFVLLPWLELLDLDKWSSSKSCNPAPEHDSRRKALGDEEDVSVASAGNSSTRESPCVLCLIDRNAVKRRFTVSEVAARGVESLSRRLSLCQICPERLCAVMLSMSLRESEQRGCAQGDGLISRVGFDQIVSSLLAIEAGSRKSSTLNPKTTNDEDISTALVALHSMFTAFDRADSDLVDVEELACGLALLTKGTKSEKLAFAFDLMDEDHDSRLTKRGLWRYFRSILTAIISLSGAMGGMSVETSMKIVDDASLVICQSLWDYGDGQGVSFDDLAEWYSKDGHRASPWLELLDFTKWRLFALENSE